MASLRQFLQGSFHSEDNYIISSRASVLGQKTPLQTESCIPTSVLEYAQLNLFAAILYIASYHQIRIYLQLRQDSLKYTVFVTLIATYYTTPIESLL